MPRRPWPSHSSLRRNCSKSKFSRAVFHSVPGLNNEHTWLSTCTQVFILLDWSKPAVRARICSYNIEPITTTASEYVFLIDLSLDESMQVIHGSRSPSPLV